MTSVGSSSLDKRVHDLLGQTRTLEPAQKKAIATELGVPEKLVEATFARQLAVLEKASAHVENVAVSTQKLRDGVGDGVGTKFQGQKTANASSSPALRGMNLSAPGDNERALKKLTHQLDKIVVEARIGVLSGADLDRALAALPKLNDDAAAFLWTPAGEKSRHAMEKAFGDLANVAPNAIVTVNNGESITARMDSLILQMTEAQFTGDTATAAASAHIFATDYPNAGMAQYARQIAGMVGEVPVRDASWADKQMKEGSYALPSGVSLEVSGKELLVSVKPGVDTSALVAQGFTFYGDTGKLVPPADKAGYRAGSYTLPGGGSLVVGAGNALSVKAPEGQQAAWQKALGDLGGAHTSPAGGTDIPRAPSRYWPTWKKLDMSIGDGTAMHLSQKGVSFDVPPYGVDDLKKLGFTVDDNGRATPPLDKDGAMIPGDYKLPNNARLVVGKDNAFSLDISRLVDFEYDKIGPALEKAGFARAGDVFTPAG